MASIVEISEAKVPVRERPRPNNQLQKAQKMDAIATLAGGIAHQFNNALVGIMGNVELLKVDFCDNLAITEYINPINTAVRRMTLLTSQLLAFARGGKYQPKKISLTDLVERTLPILIQGIDPAISVETDLQCPIRRINADSGQIEMVLSTVLINAFEAIANEGQIRVRTREEVLGNQYPGIRPGLYVCLIVEDNGVGMDEETQKRIFEPFFTTKLQGRGLGMAAVYGIVRNHDGCLSVESAPGKGTVVRMYLPAAGGEIRRSSITHLPAGQ